MTVLLPIGDVMPKVSPAELCREVIARCKKRGIRMPTGFEEHYRLLCHLEADNALLYQVELDANGTPTSVRLAPLDASLSEWRPGQRC